MKPPCHGKTALFFASDGRADNQYMKAAKAICQTCPFRNGCLEIALTENHRYGIWGGTTPKERRKIRRERGIKRKNQKSIYPYVQYRATRRNTKPWQAVIPVKGSKRKFIGYFATEIEAHLAVNKALGRDT